MSDKNQEESILNEEALLNDDASTKMLMKNCFLTMNF